MNSFIAGRSSGMINAGRSASSLLMGGGPVGWTGSANWNNWPFPRSSGMCAPIVPCCCKGPVTIAPGEIAPIILNWGAWIDSVPGYSLNTVAEATLYDMTVVPPAPADEDIIHITSGIGLGDDPPPDNADGAGFVGLIPPYGTQVLIAVSNDARIGAQYRLTICMIARDCDGRKIRQCDCVVITIAEC